MWGKENYFKVIEKWKWSRENFFKTSEKWKVPPGQDCSIGLFLWQRIPAEDDRHQEDQDDQGDKVAKHDPGREGEGVHDEVVEEDG